MTEDLHPIDDLFRSGIEGKEDSPSPEVWKNIENELEGKDRRPIAGYFWRSRKAAAILLAIIGAAGIFAAGYYIRGVKISDKKTIKPSIEILNNPTTRDSVSHPGLTVMETEGKPSENTISGATLRRRTTSVSQAQDPSADASKVLPSKDDPKTTTKVDRSSADVNTAHTNASGKSTNTSLKPKFAAGQQSNAATNKTIIASTIDQGSPGSSSGKLSGATGLTAHRNSTTGTVYSPKARSKTSPKETKAPTGQSTKAGAGGNKSTIPVARELNTDEYENTVMTHEAASIAETAGERDLPSIEKRISPSSNALPKEKKASTTATRIPVKNKRTGSLDLPRFSITPVISAQSGNTRINEKDDVWNSGKVKADMERTEHEPFTVSAGILADFRISKSITLQSGLVLQQHNIHIDPKTVWAAKGPDGKMRYKFDCTAGTYYMNPKQGTYLRPGDSATTKYSTNELNYLNIPLSVKWNFGNSKFQFFAIAGGGLNLLTKHDLQTGLQHVYNYNQEAQVTNLRNNYINGMIGAGVNWRFSNKFSLNLNPQYQFAVTPMNENMPVDALPRTFSMQVGLQIKLR